MLTTQQVQAQCLPLRVIDRSLVTGRIEVDSIALLLNPNDWELHHGSNPYWTPRVTSKADKTNQHPEAWVELRRTNRRASYDLLYKTKQYACITQLRAELRRQVSLRSEPVNCVQCEAERLVGYDFTITIFNQKDRYNAKQTEFPYVLVMRRTVLIESEEEAPEASSQFKIPR